MEHSYWKKQTSTSPLFPSVSWSRPERRDQAGKLLIIGGSAGNFRAVALAYETALKTGIGEVKVLVPDSLKKMIPPVITDIIFAPSKILIQRKLPHFAIIFLAIISAIHECLYYFAPKTAEWYPFVQIVRVQSERMRRDRQMTSRWRVNQIKPPGQHPFDALPLDYVD